MNRDEIKNIFLLSYRHVLITKYSQMLQITLFY